MKIKLILVLFISTICIKGLSQNAYYDAMKIKDLFKNDTLQKDSTTVSNFIFYIKKYLPENLQEKTDKAIISDLYYHGSMNYNPFFHDYLFDASKMHNWEFDKTKGERFIGNSLGSLDVTTIADGLAQFLIKRGKEELNIAFFQRMKEFLEKNVEAKALFPSTEQFLGKIASYRYSEFLPSLREAFYKDITNLVVNLNSLIDLPKYQDLLKKLPEIRIAIRSALIFSELAQSDSSMHPANLISYFASLKEWGEMNINLQSSWQVLNVISQSVRRLDTIETIKSDTTNAKSDTIINVPKKLSDELTITEPVKVLKGQNIFTTTKVSRSKATEDVAWVSFSEFNKNILSDSITLKIFLGLLYQKMDSVEFRDAKGNVVSVQKFMNDNKDNILQIADLVENFLVLANDVEQSIKDLKNKKDNLTNDDYYTYIQKAIDVVDYGFKVANTIKDGIADDRYIKIARNAGDLYKNIYTKNYNAAVMNAYIILDEVLTKNDNAVHEKDKRIISSLLPSNLSDSVKLTIVGHLKKAYLTYNNRDSIKNLLKDVNRLNAIKDTVLSKDIMADISKINDSLNKDTIKLNSFINYLAELSSTKAVPDSNITTVEKILKYGNMMASIVKAGTSQEAEAAIEAAVLPAGSSSIKKNTAWNFSLNAYIGGYFGRTLKNSAKVFDSNYSSFGVTAPVGFALSKGLSNYKNGTSYGSISLYITLIDVGAIVGYRLNDDSTALDSKITLNDIFTPGAYLIYGIGIPIKGFFNIPLSIGYGWQYGSKLYQKNDDGKLAKSGSSRWRGNFFVAIDIPLVNFYSRDYKKKK